MVVSDILYWCLLCILCNIDYCKGSGRNLYILHSFTFRTLYAVLCTLYLVHCTAASYPCTPSLLMSIYRRKDGGDQGTSLYLFTSHSSYYQVTRPYLRIFYKNRVTFTFNNLRQPLQGLATLVAYSLGVIESKITDCYRRRCWDNCKRRIKQLWETYLSLKESLVRHSNSESILLFK